jgi:hypothetical protein
MCCFHYASGICNVPYKFKNNNENVKLFVGYYLLVAFNKVLLFKNALLVNDQKRWDEKTIIGKFRTVEMILTFLSSFL